MKNLMRAGFFLFALGALSACTWVETTGQGEKVRVLSAAEVVKCKKLGTTTVSLMDKLAGIRRSPQKVQQELNTLARNSAVELDGDTVVPVGEPEEGRQVFEVYRCMPR